MLVMPDERPNLTASSRIWMASSRVGARTSAEGEVDDEGVAVERGWGQSLER